MKSRAIILAAGLAAGLATAAPAFAQAELTFDPWIDGAVAAGGLGVGLGTALLLDAGSPAIGSPDPALIPALDAAFMAAGYDPGSAAVSDITQYLAAFSPMAFLFLDGDEWIESAAITVEALAWTYSAKNLLKYAFPRLRPWTYAGTAGVPPEVQAEAWQSFPSGHSALAFAGATALTTMILSTGGHGEAGAWLIAGGYALATTTAVLRVCAGEHFLGDVLAGAALGSGIGWLTAFLHLKSASAPDGEAPAASLSPTASGLMVSIALD